MNIAPFVFNITINVCSFIFYLFLIIIYFRKNANYSIKNNVFKKIIYFGLFGFLFEFIYLLLIHYSIVTSLIGIAKKGMLLCFTGSLLLWSYYVFILIFEKDHDKSSVILSNHYSIDTYLLLSICTIGLIELFLPLSYSFGENGFVQYIHGAGIIFMYIIAGIIALLPLPIILIKSKELNHKRLLSYYIILIMVALCLIVLIKKPVVSIVCFFFTLGCYLIYYRLENPDLLYIRKYKNNKERMRSLRENYAFLFNMSPELRNLLNEISFMKENYLLDNKKNVNKKKLDTLINDFIKSSEDGETSQTNIDDDGIEILDVEEDIPEEMLVTKEIYSLKELKEVLKEDNLPKW